MQVKASSVRRVRRSGLWTVLLLGTGGAVVPVAAKQPSHVTRSQAGRLAEVDLKTRIEAAIGRSDFGEAHRLLDDSYRQAPQPEKLYLLAVLAQAEGRRLESVDLFRRFLVEPGTETAVAQAVAKQAVSEPVPIHGEVIVQGDRGAVLTVDERPVGVLPLAGPLLLSPGPHKLATSLGNKRQEEQCKVLASRTMELRFDLSSDVVVTMLHPAALFLQLSSEKSAESGISRALGDDETQVIERAVSQVTSRHNLGVQGQTAALLVAPQLASCLTELRCQLSLAKDNQATMLLVLRAEVSSPTGRDLVLRLTAIDSSVAEEAATGERTCAACVSSKVGELMGELVSQVLGDALGRPRGTLEVHSNPDGAEVLLSDKLLGRTPLKRPMWVGSFPLTIRKEGFASQQRQVSIVAGQKQTVEVSLPVGLVNPPVRRVTLTEGGPPERGNPGQRPRWRIITGASSTVIGAVVIGFGISALAINSRCVMGLADPGAQCMRIYDTTAPGAALTAVGGAALLSGTVLLVWPPSLK